MKTISLFICVSILGLYLGPVKAQAATLFKYIDSEGDPVLASQPDLQYPAEFNKNRFHRLIIQAAIENSLEPNLLEAVIANESNWHSKAISYKGAKGLMQLMPETARNWGVRNVFDPKQNIFAGASYLRHLLDLFDHNLAKALAAYHSGENRVIRAGGVPPIKATREYVDSVLRTYAQLDMK